MTIITKSIYKIIISYILIVQLIFSSMYPIGVILADEIIIDIAIVNDNEVNTIEVVTTEELPIITVITDTPVQEDTVSTSTLEDILSTSTSDTSTSTIESDVDLTVASTTASSTDQTLDLNNASTSIITGDAVVTANVLNLVNTNLVNSTGNVIFSNIYEGHVGDIDFRNAVSGSTTCTLSSCTEDTILVKIKNDASIENDITLVAITGNNVISNTDSALIETGDAYVGLNLVNIANTNFIDSNYLLISLNAFQGVKGDIVFPSLSQFFNSLATNSISGLSVFNTSAVNNNIDIDANTGDNKIEDVVNSSILTGTSSVVSTTLNNLNTTLAGGNNLSILFKINGIWQGNIFGIPDGFTVIRGSDGSIYISSQALEIVSSGDLENMSVNATNTVSIDNNINIKALTGQNTITGADTALISAGDAYAGVNVVNIANGNVVGHNWMLAVLNIFGDFTGDIAFGRPDLWLGERVDVPSRIENGTEVTYIYTIKNKGDSISTNVNLTDNIDIEHVEILNSSLPYEFKDGIITWQLGSLSEGDTKEVTYKAKIKNVIPGTLITNISKVAGIETDNNLTDNSDTATLVASENVISGSGGGGSGGSSNSTANIGGNNDTGNNGGAEQSLMSGITVKRKDISIVLDANQRVTKEELVIKNSKNVTISNVVLHDVLRDMEGKEIHTEDWNIGDIKPYEEIVISYDITFDHNAVQGIYTLSTVLTRNSKLEKVFPSNGTIELTVSGQILAGVPVGSIFTNKINSNTSGHESELIPELLVLSNVEASTDNSNVTGLVYSGYDVLSLIRFIFYLLLLIVILFFLLKELRGRGKNY